MNRISNGNATDLGANDALSNVYESFDLEQYDYVLEVPNSEIGQIAEQLYKNLGLGSRSGNHTSVLSVGVGTGRLDIALIEKIAKDALGHTDFVAVEPSSGMLKRFREKLIKADWGKNNAGYKKGNVTVKLLQQSFPPKSCYELEEKFDVVLALFVLHAVSCWQEALLEMFKLLKPGGFIVFAEECGDIQWLDNHFADMQRVLELESREKDHYRWLLYEFWREYHRLRRDMLGKGWYPLISASNLGPVKDILSELDRLGWGKLESFTREWKGNPVTMGELLDWVGGDKKLFTPLLFWGLTKSDLCQLRERLGEWLKSKLSEGDPKQIQIPRKEGHKFYIYQKPEPTPPQFQKILEHLLRRFYLSNATLIARTDYIKVKIEVGGLTQEKNSIYIAGCDRLNWLYQHCFRGQGPLGLVYISRDLIGRSGWQSPVPILLAGVPREELIEFIASYALYPWFQFSQVLLPGGRVLSLNQIMFREMPEAVVFCFRRVSAENEVSVDVASYRESGCPPSIDIGIPIELSDCEKQKLIELRRDFENKLKGAITEKFPVLGDVAIINYEDFLEIAKGVAESRRYSETADGLARKFANVIGELKRKLKSCLESLRNAYGWNNKLDPEALSERIAEAIAGVFLIGVTTKYWVCELQWIPAKGIIEKDREQTFAGIVLLKLTNCGGRYMGDPDELMLIQTLDAGLDGIREQSRFIAYQTVRAGIRTAVAAIMGRNMSHNIGSHAVWHIAQMGLQRYESEVNRFLLYLQKRMDFIAQVSTSPPSWCMTMKWNGTDESSLMMGFTEQKCLLDNIAWSYKVRYCDFWFRDPNIQNDEKPEIRLKIQQCSPPEDIAVDIPHGQIGAQAFYTILENLIRNTAKYGDRTRAAENAYLPLEFTVKIEEEWDDLGKGWKKNYYRVLIRDNWETSQETVEKLNDALAEPIVDPETGELKPGNWGMKEIKICAGYLRMVRPEEIDDKYQEWKGGSSSEPPLIEAKLTNSMWEEVQDQGHLTYILYLLRPKKALLVGKFDSLTYEGGK